MFVYCQEEVFVIKNKRRGDDEPLLGIKCEYSGKLFSVVATRCDVMKYSKVVSNS